MSVKFIEGLWETQSDSLSLSRPLSHKHTSGLCADCAFDVVGPQDRLFDLTALHQVERHHEGLQSITTPLRHKYHLRRDNLIYSHPFIPR